MMNLIEIYNFLKTLNINLDTEENQKYISELKLNLKEKIFNDLIEKEMNKKNEYETNEAEIKQRERDEDRCDKCGKRGDRCWCVN